MMSEPSWTVDEMLAERPCERYTRETLEELWNGKECLSLSDILEKDIPGADKSWVCCRPIVGELRDKWLERVVTRAVRDHALHCGVLSVAQWAQSWLDGTDRSARAADAAARAADAAAYAAAYAAADAAARAAANAAAYAAADAARAADAAAYAAADAAYAAYDGEYLLQVQDMRDVIENGKGGGG
jgi:cobalamin biosynthesis Mg chelatase CobN